MATCRRRVGLFPSSSIRAILRNHRVVAAGVALAIRGREMSAPDAIVIGAGPAGLAAAQRLGASGLKSVIYEKAEAVGSVWRRHYDRLHLHMPRAHSALPGLPMPASFGRYPSRTQFIDYLQD